MHVSLAVLKLVSWKNSKNYVHFYQNIAVAIATQSIITFTFFWKQNHSKYSAVFVVDITVHDCWSQKIIVKYVLVLTLIVKTQ